MSEIIRLKRNQAKALAAILAHKTIGEAADACGLSTKTLQRYMADENFKAALNAGEGERIDQATRQLLILQAPAVATMARTMGDQTASPAVRLRAAQLVLDYLIKLRELRSVEERLVALERLVLYDNHKTKAR
jgi:hypothetical protein